MEAIMFQKVVTYLKKANEDDQTVLGGVSYLAVGTTLYGIGIWFIYIFFRVAMH